MSLKSLSRQPSDPLLALIEAVSLDVRADKIDLSVGVFRDESGRTPILAVVKLAEQRLLDIQESKAYLGPEGDAEFVSLLATLVLGQTPGVSVRGMQTTGGTGALRVAADVLALGHGRRRIWVGLPTWANHVPVLEAAGLDVLTFSQYDLATQTMDIEGMFAALEGAIAGDAVLLQACCHNPTGIDPDRRTWAALAAFMAERDLIPLIDMAYHGLGDGLSEDAWMVSHFTQVLPTTLIAYSCNKNFALYRDRVGALFATSRDADLAECVLSNAASIVRANYSMPPDHGAAVVRIILSDESLRSVWQAELETMRLRIQSVRRAIEAYGNIGNLNLEAIESQRGMFSTLPLVKQQIDRLREGHAVYMAGSGRINLAGMPLASVERFVDALQGVVELEIA